MEPYGGTVEQCGMVWWNSVERYSGTVEQCGATVLKSVVEQSNSGTVWWNSVSGVGQCGETLEQWKSVVEERSSVEQCNGTLEQYGTAWWNSVERCGGTVWNGMVEQ